MNPFLGESRFGGLLVWQPGGAQASSLRISSQKNHGKVTFIQR